MPRERFLAKLHAYHSWHAAVGHTAALGIRSFRVLTVTKSAERMRSLLRSAAGDAELGSSRGANSFAVFPVIASEDVGGVFATIWRTAAEPERPVSIAPFPSGARSVG